MFKSPMRIQCFITIKRFVVQAEPVLFALGLFLDEDEGKPTVSGMPLIIRRHDM